MGEDAHAASRDAVATRHLAELLLDEWQHSDRGDLWDLIDASDDGAEERADIIRDRLFKSSGSVEPVTEAQAEYLAALAEDHWLDPDEIVTAAGNKYRASRLIDLFRSDGSMSRDELQEAIAAVLEE